MQIFNFISRSLEFIVITHLIFLSLKIFIKCKYSLIYQIFIFKKSNSEMRKCASNIKIVPNDFVFKEKVNKNYNK